MKSKLFLLLTPLFLALSIHAAPPIINYAGKVSVDGQPYTGTGLFKFAILNAENNATLWSNDGTSVNGSQPSASVGISVNGGLYSILLGNNAISGMGSIDPTIFHQHNDTRLRIWFSDGQGFEQLTPDRPFASVPYALNANIAPGSIENQHLSPSVRADLNTTVSFPGTIISVPEGQSPPPGYSLHRTAEPNPLQWKPGKQVNIQSVVNNPGLTVALNGKIYYLCGGNEDPYTRGKECAVYDPINDQWTTIASPNFASYTPSAIVNNGKIYLLNGINLEIYDPEQNNWSQGPSVPIDTAGLYKDDFFGSTTAKVADKIWVLGGAVEENSNNYKTGYFFSFDLNSNTWTDESSALTEETRDHNLYKIGISQGYEFNGRALFLNLKTEDSGLKVAYSFDPTTRTWRKEFYHPSVISSFKYLDRIFIYVNGKGFQIYEPQHKSFREFSNNFPHGSPRNLVELHKKVYSFNSLSGNSYAATFYADLNASFGNPSTLYIKDGNASAGVPTVQAEVADGHVTTNKLFDGSVTSAKIAPNSVDYPHLSPAVRSDLNRTITKSMLGSDVLNDLNRTITKDMLSTTIRDELNASATRPVGATLANPYGISGDPIVSDGTTYTVPLGKILIITSSGFGASYNSKKILVESGGPAILPAGTVVSSISGGWSGILCNPISNIDPVVSDGGTYTVPSGKVLIITSSGFGATYNSKKILDERGGPAILPAGTTVVSAPTGWSGYLKTQ